jgi:hypothetical protein
MTPKVVAVYAIPGRDVDRALPVARPLPPDDDVVHRRMERDARHAVVDAVDVPDGRTWNDHAKRRAIRSQIPQAGGAVLRAAKEEARMMDVAVAVVVFVRVIIAVVGGGGAMAGR